MLEFSAANEAEILKNPQVVIKFFATWCRPCDLFGSGAWPRLVEANSDVLFLECDSDRNPEMSEKYKVTSLPTVVFLRDGLEASRIQGLKRQANYQEEIDKIK